MRTAFETYNGTDVINCNELGKKIIIPTPWYSVFMYYDKIMHVIINFDDVLQMRPTNMLLRYVKILKLINTKNHYTLPFN